MSQENRNESWQDISVIALEPIYADLGEKRKALDYYNQALPILRPVNDRVREAVTLSNIDLIYNELSERSKALYQIK